MSRYVLGLSGLYHDSGAALLCDGKIVAAANEERFSRLKHDSSLPVHAARWCLSYAGVKIEDVELVAWYEKPLRKFERILVNQILEFPRSFTAFRRSTFSWLTDKLWVRNRLIKELGVPASRLVFGEHHRSHAASAFYASPWTDAAVLTVDGVGEWATTTLYQGGGEGLAARSELRFPHSIGLMYSAFTAYLGFAVNDGEYKVMGMAPYGRPRFVDEIRRVFRLGDDGAFEVDLDYFSWHWSATDSFTEKLVALLGPPRFPGEDFDPKRPEDQRFADIAASVQQVTEDALVGLATRLHRDTGQRRLCLAGGVALNSVANRQILLRSPFEELFVQPAAGDAGGALGAALWAWNEVLGGPRVDVGLVPGLGQASPDEQTGEMLSDLKAHFERLDDDTLVERAAEDVADGKVLGWVQGRFEWGPRSLGHRSILADPRRADMRDRINARVKYRELFRPFAPSIRADVAHRYVDLPAGGEQPAQWMLLVAPVKDPEILPATTHVDGTARVQTVYEAQNPRYHRLLDAVEARTGHPALLNTSFNLKGEPMVSSPVQAYATFKRSGLDVLYLGNFRVERGGVDG